ncbi:interleukin-17D-like [Branchiostoma floridae]|uniref:Interleukin-17D-like n=1 Tax=Branchiostoma floridae TaxID=7739 RepID=A0A9J7LC82_BRAFL|nr:interleukin-17D-like [Branchiostoma floridae]
MVLVIMLAAEQEARGARKRGKGKIAKKTRPCRKERNRQWCNKDNVEEMLKNHTAVHKENIKKALEETEQETCPAGERNLRDDDSRDPNERSLSPWTYVKNESANRIPGTYVEAKCLCDGCLIYGKDGVSVENSKDYESLPIKTSLPILTRYDCKGKKCRERLEIAQVTVGCVCATRKRATVPPSQ